MIVRWLSSARIMGPGRCHDLGTTFGCCVILGCAAGSVKLSGRAPYPCASPQPERGSLLEGERRRSRLLVAGGWKTCHVPRRTWLDSKIDVFLEELAASGMHLDRQRAGELITGQVRAVATLMSVTEATARTYLGDEIIKDMARRMLFEVASERPGADLMEAPRTVPLPLALVGIAVAALAEAMQVRAANEPPGHLGDVITTYAQNAVRARADHRRRRAGAGRRPGRDPVPAGVAAPCSQVHQRRRRPGCERRQTSGRDSRDGTQPAGRDPAPRC